MNYFKIVVISTVIACLPVFKIVGTSWYLCVVSDQVSPW